MAEYRYLAKPDPEWVDVSRRAVFSSPVCVLNIPQFPNNLPPGTAVVGMSRVRDPITPQEGLDIYEFEQPVRDGHPVRLRVYRRVAGSPDVAEKLPLFLYMHGGGYVTGGLETDDATCREIALKIEVVVVSIEYRLAPEHKFPVGFQDCTDIVRWVSFQSHFTFE